MLPFLHTTHAADGGKELMFHVPADSGKKALNYGIWGLVIVLTGALAVLVFNTKTPLGRDKAQAVNEITATSTEGKPVPPSTFQQVEGAGVQFAGDLTDTTEAKNAREFLAKETEKEFPKTGKVVYVERQIDLIASERQGLEAAGVAVPDTFRSPWSFPDCRTAFFFERQVYEDESTARVSPVAVWKAGDTDQWHLIQLP